MEAFIPSSTFAGVLVNQNQRCMQKSSRRPQTIFMAKKKNKTSGPPSKASNPQPSSSTFAGLAAGPAQKSKPARPSLRRKKVEKVMETDGKAESSENGKEDGIVLPRATQALGTKKPREAPVISKKTAADFIAEGVEDDVEESFEEADIRFGIDDVLDPFKVDKEKEGEVKKMTEAESDLASVGNNVDVTGDAGVTKVMIKPGEGEIAAKGANVVVEYTGRLEDGTVFDSSRKRKGGFEFELGAGRVIKGWEAGVATMRKGEVAEFTIAPSYAYGRRGMPPVIPGNAPLTFEIEVTDFKGGEGEPIKEVAEYNPEIARTPEEIAKSYDARLETQGERKKKMPFFERFYIISPFASQNGELPPWWLNPNITAFIIIAFCAFGFYLVWISGAIHIGYVDHPVDVNIFK